jgi:hypothetical protein
MISVAQNPKQQPLQRTKTLTGSLPTKKHVKSHFTKNNKELNPSPYIAPNILFWLGG